MANINHQTIIDVRTDISILHGYGGETHQAIQLRNDSGILLHLCHIFGHRQHQFGVEAILYCLNLALCGEYLLLVFFEFLGDIALCVHQCLFANPCLWHLVAVGVAHLQVVAKDIVVSDFQTADTCGFHFALLQLQQVVLAVGLYVAQFVQLCIDASCKDIRSALYSGWVWHQFALDAFAYLGAER